ncbi:MAG: dihydroorotate dehydrogenase electron transfer subunit [Deltaproteobacteria bacterium]|jgi:NAD(P)H-flavin reductase|nr:dihydroorotate dehydrogenase electron transfer subunit [Deltaproteobacteria bacterium]
MDALPSGFFAKRSILCECTSSSFAAGNIIALQFAWSGPAPRGGQFFLIKPWRSGVFLARPLSVAGWEPRGGPEDGGILRFLAARRGRGTWELADLRAGEEAELSGPLGKPFEAASFPKGPLALVGGGIGIAPLLALAVELGSRPFDFYAGFRSTSFGLESLKARSLAIATEDGCEGLKGRIPDFFSPQGYEAVFACGPLPLLRAVGDACIAGGIPCFLSMEKHMACGVGACLGCTVKTTGGNKRCCADGPVFRAEEIIFDD